MHNNREIEEDMTHRIKIGWLKSQNALEVLYKRQIPTKLEENAIGHL